MNNLRRRLVSEEGPFPGAMTNGSKAQALDVLFSSNNGELLCVVSGQENWPDNDWTPIGIVIVPGTHNRYGDGSCGVMSLVAMDTGHPESGQVVQNSSLLDDTGPQWGHYNALVGNSIFSGNTAITTQGNYIPYLTNSSSLSCSALTGALVWPYGGTTTSPTNEASMLYSNTNGYVSDISGSAGCDFNGIRNTAAIYVKTLTSNQWTRSTVPLETDTLHTPAAACAGRFKTLGTRSFLDVYSGITTNYIDFGTTASNMDNKGFWYLPAEGELCYLPSKRFEINNVLLALNQKYGNVCRKIQPGLAYLSSSEKISGYCMWVVDLGSGYLNYYDRDYNMVGTRAFLRF